MRPFQRSRAVLPKEVELPDRNEWVVIIEEIRKTIIDFRSRSINFRTLPSSEYLYKVFSEGAEWDETCELSMAEATQVKYFGIGGKDIDYSHMKEGECKYGVYGFLDKNGNWALLEFFITKLPFKARYPYGSWKVTSFRIQSATLPELLQETGSSAAQIFQSLFLLQHRIVDDKLTAAKEELRKEDYIRSKADKLAKRGVEFNYTELKTERDKRHLLARLGR